jgi:hypothetical protein
MIPRARWAHTKESTTRPSAWRVRARARARASLALGSALACAIVTSALLLSGSVRTLRGAIGTDVERDDTRVVAEAPLQKATAVPRAATGHHTSCRTVIHPDGALAWLDDRLPDIASSRARQSCSIVSRSHGTVSARGYDAMAPPVERA